jgi:hypothetical protein
MRQIFTASDTIVTKIRSYFVEQAAGRSRDAGSAAVPPPEHMARMLSAAFWSSLEREEGWPTRVSLAYFAAPLTGVGFSFVRPLPLSVRSLARVAPAVERPGVHLVVAPDDAGHLRVWGAALHLPPRCFVVEVTRPGELIVKHPRSGPFSKFVNVAVIAGEDVKLVADSQSRRLECRTLLATLLEEALASPGVGRNGPAGVLVDLALSMRTHGRGGTLLVVPAGHERWRDSIRSPLPYAALEPFSELRVHADALAAGANGRRRARYARAVEAVAGLTAVDGATVMTEALDVVAFGAKIIRREGASLVESVLRSEPVEGNVPTVEHPSTLGGTRHLSAAQFVFDQRDALAFVSSQDGRFTVFAWSTCDACVHARRIDVLVL